MRSTAACQHCIAVHYITLHYITLHYIALHHIALHSIAFPCIPLHSQHFTVNIILYIWIQVALLSLQCIALHYIATGDTHDGECYLLYLCTWAWDSLVADKTQRGGRSGALDPQGQGGGKHSRWFIMFNKGATKPARHENHGDCIQCAHNSLLEQIQLLESQFSWNVESWNHQIQLFEPSYRSVQNPTIKAKDSNRQTRRILEPCNGRPQEPWNYETLQEPWNYES